MKPFAASMGWIGTESAFEVLARARDLEKKGKKIWYFNIGEPDFPTAPNIIEAAKKALDAGYTHYVPAPGIPEVREAVCEYVNRTRGFRPEASQVLMVPGAKPIITFTVMALCNPGDEVLYPDPGFPIYESMIQYIGAKAVPIKLLEKNEFRMSPEDIKASITSKTKLIIINTPQNPTGSALGEEEVHTIADLCHDKGIWLLTDEVYNEILYEGKHFSPSVYDKCQEHTILLDGFSKTYAMTGWRLGYGVMPKELIKYETLLTINSVSCTSAFSQMAAKEALLGPQESVRKMVAEFKKRRDLIVDGLNQVKGWSCLKPKGAFYVFPNVRALGKRSKEIENHLLNDLGNLGIATLCGTSFGAGGEGYMRFSYASPVKKIEEMLEILKKEYGTK